VYLAVRFRWNYGLSAVAAMFHDLVILVGLFAWMGKEIDGVFLAALLTVIGYSVNDSVVVFDRVREQWRMRVRESLATVTNDACLQTIPRTINTGLGALLILVALFFLGGETLTDFALALIVGIALGTYSSVFTAAPLCVVIDRLRPAPPSPARVSGVSSRAKRPRPWAHGRLR
jgi:SecD/SecF fusion protein